MVHDGSGTRTNRYTADGLLESITLPQQPGWELRQTYDPLGRRIALSAGAQDAGDRAATVYAKIQ